MRSGGAKYRCSVEEHKILPVGGLFDHPVSLRGGPTLAAVATVPLKKGATQLIGALFQEVFLFFLHISETPATTGQLSEN